MNSIQNYELNIIFNQDTPADLCEKQINSFLEEIGAVDIDIQRQAVQKLAYPIKKHSNGLYYLINFKLDLENVREINTATIKFNRSDSILRYLVLNQTDFLIQKSKENLNTQVEFASHRELNKGAGLKKKCFTKYMGIRAIDYKDVDYLNQFTSPYAKLFGKVKTGSSSKYQRKIAQALKRARHMAYMPFTDKWMV